jgi:two-component system response regulator HydG
MRGKTAPAVLKMPRVALFLDEIGNISLQQQAKLLTILQNRQVTRLGTNKAVDIDIRLICATNVPMSELANENKFP